MKLAHTSEISRAKSEHVLDKVKSLKPNQVVVWYHLEDGTTGVEISEGTERVKAVGALTIAAQEVWDA